MSVDVRAERHAFFFDIAEIRQRKHLKSAGIRQDRPAPGHKFMQSAEFLHNLIARAKMKMIGI